MSIQSVFNRYASEYDSARRNLIPCFDDFYQTAIAEIPFPHEQEIDALDMGAGTGLMAGLVASRYPNAKIRLIDVAEKMLSEAKKNLKCFPNKFEFSVANYAQLKSFGKSFDLVISSLSIHHLPEVAKQHLFKSIHAHLKPGGIFINADQVLGETEEIEKRYRQRWIEQVKGKGTTDRELSAAFERMKEDKMSTLSSQMMWLKAIGFVNVNCWYKNYSFAVLGGTKEKI